MAQKRIEISFNVDTANADEYERVLQRIHDAVNPLVNDLTGKGEYLVQVVRKRRTRAEMEAARAGEGNPQA